MGLILGRFRKKKTTLEQLEKIDTDIKSIEKFRLNTELAQRKIVGHFILISVGVYILVAIVFYFYFFPATFHDQLFYITPLLLVPFIIWGVKRLLTWYYRRKISRDESKLTVLRTEKKKLLEQVMDTETYKVAKTILEKFAPDQLRKSPGSYEVTPYKPISNTVSTPGGLRARNVAGAKTPGVNIPRTPAPAITAGVTPAPKPTTAVVPATPGLNTNGQQGALVMGRPGRLSSTPLPMPREILPRDRSVLDKMVEYLVGDGPSNRYALICKNCNSHNGMALRDEFEYVDFRCCYCFTFNPARKLRPHAPKLEFDLPRTPSKRRDSEKSTSSSEKNSATDTESEKESGDSRKNSEVENVPMEVDATPDLEEKSKTD